MMPEDLFFFLKIFWLLEVFFGPTQILEFLVLFLWKMILEFLFGLYLICGLLWLVQTFNTINSSNPWGQTVSPFICVFFNYFPWCLVVFQCTGPEHWWLNVILNFFFFWYNCKWDCFLNFAFWQLLKKYNNSIYLFLAVLGLCCCTGFSVVVWMGATL